MLDRCRQHPPAASLLHCFVAPQAFGVPGRRIDVKAGTGDILLRREQQPTIIDPSGWERRNLAPAIAGLPFEFMRTTIPPGVDCGVFPPHKPGSREHVAVSEGRLTLTIAGTRYDLEAGDAISYAGDCWHRFVNTGTVDCIYYLALVE